MTLQQIEYILALDKHRQFVAAAEECEVTQPTLSMMISKLESELDVQIFDRSKKPLEPTELGERILQQARSIRRESRKISEIINSASDQMNGTLRLGVIPTLAPYLLPDFIHLFSTKCPEIDLHIQELETDTLIHELHNDHLDLCIAATPLDEEGLYEIPLYYEQFLAYFSPAHPLKDQTLSTENMPRENLWVLEQGHCLRDQVFNFCSKKTQQNQIFQAGSIDTLIRIVDRNGGYTIIPELHQQFLTAEQKKNLRNIDDPAPVREISLVLPRDFVREKLLNAVSETIQSIIPSHMIDTKLKKYSIRLK